MIADKLSENNLKFIVPNARHHKQEAEIVSKAGQLYAITVATNMAGRTDIKLSRSKIAGVYMLIRRKI